MTLLLLSCALALCSASRLAAQVKRSHQAEAGANGRVSSSAGNGQYEFASLTTSSECEQSQGDSFLDITNVSTVHQTDNTVLDFEESFYKVGHTRSRISDSSTFQYILERAPEHPLFNGLERSSANE